MIPHHQGAVDMCGVLTSGPTHGYAVEASLAAMCVNVVSSQSSEIATMETWLTSRAKELTHRVPAQPAWRVAGPT